jgi:hypothetical protein
MAEINAASLLAQGEIEFDFEKSNLFRAIHVDGFFGGISPATQLLHVAVYNERQPIPKKVFHPVNNGALQPENLAKREVRGGLFREVEADLIISLETAMALRIWLDERIGEMQNTRAQLAALTPNKG